MWGVYFHIVDLYLNDKGVIDTLLSQASVPLINYMVKAPEVFKTQQFNNQGTPLDMLLNYIAKCFSDGDALEDENLTMTGISLIMACLEHLGQGMGQIIHQINGFYLQAMQNGQSRHLKNMLVQGVMMNLWYEQSTTIQSLKEHGAFEKVLGYIFENLTEMDRDFEVKRLVLGLSSLICDPNISEPIVT